MERHELKLGVCYREEQAAQMAGGRGLLSGKRLVIWRGEAAELGRRLHWEAQADGLGRAVRVRSLNDGAPWIWHLVGDRWPQAEEVLDFYHASQHLSALGTVLHGEGTAATGAWVLPRRRRLRRGNVVKLLQELGGPEPPAGEAGAVVRREQNYFEQHAARMNYRELSRSGPIGSGAVESACRQQQCRFKRSGQFWSDDGLKHLCAPSRNPAATTTGRNSGTPPSSHGEKLRPAPLQTRLARITLNGSNPEKEFTEVCYP